MSQSDQYAELRQALSQQPFDKGWPALEEYLRQYWQTQNHGDFPRWQAALEQIDRCLNQQAGHWQVHNGYLQLAQQALAQNQHPQLEPALRQLMPWRKGPFSIGDINIDTEWRSDWKWQRLQTQLDFTGKRILDVGSGNGYYGYRMLDAGAEWVLGIDPTLLFVMQAKLMQRCAGHPANWVLPMTLEQLPETLTGFDMVLSLGVLYHRKDPVEHIQRLLHHLKPGGELVLETFVIPPGMGDAIEVERYARMRNVYQIPSVGLLRQWFEQAGCPAVRMVDLCRTSVEEQRSTNWMRFESLTESLDKGDGKVTVEGLPGPVRGVWIGGKAE